MLNKADPPSDKKEPVVIKKYANRRLYNTETSTYVTLDDLAAMVKSERDFVVFDAKTGDDLTHAVLTQIIVDQESQKRGETLLPIPFLRQLIRFYGASIERFVPSYLQASLETLAKEQERFRKQFAGAFTPAGAFEAYQEQARKNLAMFEQAMLMFSPFGHNKATSGKPDEDAKKPEAPKSQQSEEIAELKAQLASIQAKLEKLSDGSNK
ncbi:MAG TPA: polyhydroxyalkanoate synthesis repressor PhaR [Hyphomicrobiaceae bacterium]|nr:polyhydroxyalkanoate synthesis repressor PhaR [Hyphomicrobiaceae bacterium]